MTKGNSMNYRIMKAIVSWFHPSTSALTSSHICESCYSFSYHNLCNYLNWIPWVLYPWFGSTKKNKSVELNDCRLSNILCQMLTGSTLLFFYVEPLHGRSTRGIQFFFKFWNNFILLWNKSVFKKKFILSHFFPSFSKIALKSLHLFNNTRKSWQNFYKFFK